MSSSGSLGNWRSSTATAVPLPSGKANLLIAALLVDAGRVVSTDRLYEVF